MFLAEERHLNDLKWQLCALALRDTGGNRLAQWRKALLNRLSASHNNSDSFLEGLLVRLSGQFPLPGFSITQWNSQLPEGVGEKSAGQEACGQQQHDSATFIGMGAAMLRFGFGGNLNG